jgi:ATPase subunit of ABC transporter with duplicated ATPase domains
MDTVITRIIEIEKQSATDIERAEDAYRKNIEAHQRTLEENKERAHAQIISTENERLTQALSELNKRTEEAALTSARDYEIRFQNPALIEAIKEQIVVILLK